MMHHPNMHHQPMSGHPPQHMPAHQGHPGHHQMPPHQLHRENRHVALTRVPLGPSQSGAGGHGHPMGLGGMPVHHQRPGHPAHPPHPHPIRAMHHQPQHHHSVPPPQQLKQLRRPYMGYGAGAGAAMPPPYAQPEPPPREPPQPAHNTAAAPPPAAEGSAEAGAGDAAALDPDAAQANSKEKTPMCLVNELARYNKIKHQYRLTSETGPAHKKVFTVTLRLGDTEEYTAEGSSIKRAQHAAAHAALAGTAHAPPPPRAAQHHPHHHHHHRHSVMPTVELNALAMKLCQPAVYTSVPAVARGRGRPPPPFRVHPPFLPPQGIYQRMLNPALLYRVRVMVGGRAWLGEGGTPQAARHDAAARALNDLRPANAAATPTEEPTTVTPGGEGGENENGSGSGSPGEGGSPTPPEVKSPVSLVHELALKRGLPVLFTVKSERGPPHMRVFVTICTVGDMETEGEGNGKKVSKRRAAERMLAEMRRRWPPALLRPRPPQPDKRKHPPVKKKPRNLIKEGCVGATPTTGATLPESDNPISLLAVARHALRARSPQYAVLEERGAARRREFVVRCDAPPHSATGQGPNKKTAKRRAAQNVLVAMELTSNPAEGAAAATPPDAAADANKTTITNNNTKRKDGDPAPATTGAAGAGGDGRQPVPGVLLMDYHQRPHPAHPQPTPQTVQPHLPQLPVLHNGVADGTPATPAAGATGVAGPAAAAPAPGPAAGSAPGAKDQLMYLSQLLGFTVQFSDFPKRNHGEYLSLVSLSTEPPVMCHGGGPSTAHSHEQCSLAALRALKHMGLDAPAAAPAAPVAPVAAAAPGAPAAVAAPTGMQNLASTVPAAGVISNGISE